MTIYPSALDGRVPLKTARMRGRFLGTPDGSVVMNPARRQFARRKRFRRTPLPTPLDQRRSETARPPPPRTGVSSARRDRLRLLPTPQKAPSRSKQQQQDRSFDLIIGCFRLDHVNTLPYCCPSSRGRGEGGGRTTQINSTRFRNDNVCCQVRKHFVVLLLGVQDPRRTLMQFREERGETE